MLNSDLKNMDIQSLIKLSESNANQMRIETAKVEKVFEAVIKNCPEGDISTIERLRILSNKAMNLAKEGKIQEANNVIEELKNIR